MTNFSTDFIEYIFFQTVKAYQEGNILYIDRDELINNYHEGYVTEEKELARQIYLQVLEEHTKLSGSIMFSPDQAPVQMEGGVEANGIAVEVDGEGEDSGILEEKTSVDEKSVTSSVKAVCSPPPSYMSHASTISTTLDYDDYTTGSMTPRTPFAIETAVAF
jgi:hypothetical protein